MGLPSRKNTVTLCFVNKTAQSAFQIGPAPTRVLVKNGIMYPALEKSSASCKIDSEAVADELSTCPVAMPTQNCGYLYQEDHAELLGKCRDGLRQSR